MTPRCYKATLLSYFETLILFQNESPLSTFSAPALTPPDFVKIENLTVEIKSYLKVISSNSLLKDIFWSAEDRREQGGMMLMQNNDAGEWGAT